MEAGYVVSIFFPMDKIKSVTGKSVVEVIKLAGVRVQEFCNISIQAIGPAGITFIYFFNPITKYLRNI